MTSTNELLVWQYGVPIICITANLDFDVWQYGAPVIDIDESFGPTPVTVVRRRVFIF